MDYVILMILVVVGELIGLWFYYNVFIKKIDEIREQNEQYDKEKRTNER